MARRKYFEKIIFLTRSEILQKKKKNDTRNKFWRTVFYNIDDDDVDDFQGIKQRESSEKRTDEVVSIVGMAGIG